MARPTAEMIAQRAFDLGLLSERHLQEVWGSFGSRAVELDDFLQTLVRRELLTNYQVDRLVKGERGGFFFGDYKVLYMVGTGTFARVYRAAHKNTGQIVAVKALRNRFSDSPSQYGLFLREGELGRSLRHGNIVPIYEVHSTGHVHFLVMEFIEGRNLREFVKVRKLIEPAEATRLMIDVCRGLDYAFQQAVTHRDLRMSNVLVSSRGQAKLVDFGLASADEAMNGTFEFDMPTTRTIDYAALERATGVRKDDPRSDVYFAGCIYYHMLSGTPPLMECKNRVQRLNKSRFANILPIQKIAPTMPHYLASVLNKSMALEPNRRYQSPGEYLADLEMVAHRLAEGPEEPPAAPVEQRPHPIAAAGGEEEPRHAVMIVEANARMQDMLRDGLKKAGYRVLLTSSPERALERLVEQPDVADCLVIDAQDLGESALSAFNRLADDGTTQALPAVLLLEPEQQAWRRKAKTSKHRIVLFLPVTLRQLRDKLKELLSVAAGADAGSQP